LANRALRRDRLGDRDKALPANLGLEKDKKGKENYLTYRSREGAAPKMGFSLARKAVAAFMLDAIEQKKHFERIVSIAG
jgi:hypothetical protein